MYKTSKYSKDQTNLWRGAIALVLAESQDELTIPEIQGRDKTLIGISCQKMAVMLNELVEYGLVAKAKNRAGRMVYKSLAVMEEQGYDTSIY